MIFAKKNKLLSKGYRPTFGLHAYMVKEQNGTFIVLEEVNQERYTPHAVVDHNKKKYDKVDISNGALDHLHTIEDLESWLLHNERKQ
jgi:hypothetical protein